MSKVKIGAFLILVVLLECAAAIFLLRSAAPTEAMAHAVKEDGAAALLPAADEPFASEIAETNKVEVSLGTFGVTSYQPLSNTTLRIDFELYATVPADAEAKFSQLFSTSQHRFREQVLVILRSAELTDLTDAGLGLIKRRILEKTNRLLGEALIQEVIFSDFSFIEQ